MFMLLVKLAAPNNSSESGDAIDVLFTHPSLAELFEQMGSWTDDYLRFSQAMDTLSEQKSLRRIDAKFINLFDFIRDILRQNLTTSGNLQNLDFFFYLFSIFVWYLLRWSPAQDVLGDGSSILGQALRSLLGALYTSWSSGGKDEAFESRFKGSDPDDHRFSEEWWNGIFRHANTASPLLGLPVTPKEKTAPGAGDEDRTGTEHYLTINVGGPYDA
ncbi:hypothetical protein BDN70DRAFT_311999 [Pholiota conissans]|uniref:Uncharacterized protein n=1 Tax=Pholiota conissans TaxID=109636 RepID=A0A9P6CPZ8_9AGAR|nr:hypothetical protein BDN70DRAFT_311999 [Pholiota conissans]